MGSHDCPVLGTGLVGGPQTQGPWLRPDHCDSPELQGLHFPGWSLLPLRCREQLRPQVHSVVPGR